MLRPSKSSFSTTQAQVFLYQSKKKDVVFERTRNVSSYSLITNRLVLVLMDIQRNSISYDDDLTHAKYVKNIETVSCIEGGSPWQLKSHSCST